MTTEPSPTIQTTTVHTATQATTTGPVPTQQAIPMTTLSVSDPSNPPGGAGLKSSEFLTTMALFVLIATKKWTEITTEDILLAASCSGLYTVGRSLVKSRLPR